MSDAGKALLLLFAVRLVLAGLGSIVAGAPDAIFADPTDFFADSLKTALAQTSIAHRLLDDPRVQEWPPLVQRYLFDNDYLRLWPGAALAHLPPLGTLLTMLTAASLLVLPPLAVVALLVGCYAGGAALVARSASAAEGIAGARPPLALLLLAYPALFMLDRGNLHSGVTSLCTIFYTLSACRRRCKWTSWIALAVAVNIRPNVALFALLELCRSDRRGDAMAGVAAVGLLSVVIGLAAFSTAHAVDPRYTFAAFRIGLAHYQLHYVEGFDGLFWCASLANVAKAVRFALGIHPLFSPAAAAVVSALGLAAIVLTAALAWFRRIAPSQLAFLVAGICTLFTPVLGEYHLLLFAGPLLVLTAGWHAWQDRAPLRRAVGLLLTLQCLCFFYALAPRPLLLALIGSTALAFPIVARGSGDRGELPALACLAVLAPIGGALTQGFVVALILFAALAWMLARCAGMRQPAAA